MGKTIYSDNTDINGVNYATVGENIREGAKALTYESIEVVLEENKGKALNVLNADYIQLRSCILYMMTGDPYYSNLWGGTMLPPTTEEDKQKIKTFLGIS